jgi:hypothetical protein
MSQQLLGGHYPRRDPRADHKTEILLRLTGITGTLALLSIILLIRPMELKQLQIVFAKVRRIGHELLANRSP